MINRGPVNQSNIMKKSTSPVLDKLYLIHYFIEKKNSRQLVSKTTYSIHRSIEKKWNRFNWKSKPKIPSKFKINTLTRKPSSWQQARYAH